MEETSENILATSYFISVLKCHKYILSGVRKIEEGPEEEEEKGRKEKAKNFISLLHLCIFSIL
jgi:hypothetical protein